MSKPSNEFSIKATVNRNIEKHQYPYFHAHRSLLGWCSMNYSKVLKNPTYMLPPELQPKAKEEKEKKLETLFHIREKVGIDGILKKPFTRISKSLAPLAEEGIGQPPDGFKPTTFRLTTTKGENAKEIIEKIHPLSIQLNPIKPLSAILGQEHNSDFTKHVHQIGEIIYNLPLEDEEIKHLRKQPNSIVTEQGLMDILGPNLESLDLKNKIWISNDLICRLGYLAIHIEDLNLSGLDIDDSILIELARSCSKLRKIDISKCKKLTSEGISAFLDEKAETLVKFFANDNPYSIDDSSLKNLGNLSKIEYLNLSFCPEVSDESLKNLNFKLKELYMAGNNKLSNESLVPLVKKSSNYLKVADFTLLSQKEIGNQLFAALGECKNLKILSLTGCVNMTDDGLYDFLRGDNFKNLTALKLGGLSSISDNNLPTLATKASNLKYLELNGLDRITDYGLNAITKNLNNLEILLINITPLISQALIDELKISKPRLKIIRHLVTMSNPKDDGLRMPLIPNNILKKKPGKKKKKR